MNFRWQMRKYLSSRILIRKESLMKIIICRPCNLVRLWLMLWYIYTIFIWGLLTLMIKTCVQRFCCNTIEMRRQPLCKLTAHIRRIRFLWNFMWKIVLLMNVIIYAFIGRFHINKTSFLHVLRPANIKIVNAYVIF